MDSLWHSKFGSSLLFCATMCIDHCIIQFIDVELLLLGKPLLALSVCLFICTDTFEAIRMRKTKLRNKTGF